MSWLGKMLGGAFGFLLGGPVGAVFGTAMGHQYDRSTGRSADRRLNRAEVHEVQWEFFAATFQAMGHIAKADGRVSEAEIAAAKRIMARMELTDDMRKHAIRLFEEGKHPDFPWEPVLEKCGQVCHKRYGLKRVFLEIQLEAALADGALRSRQEQLLLQICDQLKFSRFEFHILRAALEAQLKVAFGWRGQQDYQGAKNSSPYRAAPSLADAYAALGLKSSAGNEEVKRAYRKLISQHHPDKLVANGLPAEMVRLANEKTQQIRKAYEMICESRNI
jgi:DnaJ like chaperone protein